MRSDHNKEFDKEIKKKLDEFLPEISSSLWDEIERGIRTETSINPKAISHKLLHSDSADLEMINRQINDSTVISDPKVKNIAQKIKVRSIDREIRNIDRCFKFKRFIGIAASLLIIGFSIWKFQPEEKVFLRGSESLVRKADSGLTRINPENVVTKVEIEHFRTITKVDDARIAKSPKVKISETENRKGLPFEESTLAGTSEFLQPASGNVEARLRGVASVSSSKSIALFKSERDSESERNKVSSSALPPKIRLESKDLEPIDNQELTLQNQELALNTPIQGSVSSNSNLGNQDTNLLNSPDMGNGNRLFSAEPNTPIPNGEQSLLETEPKEKQKIVSSVLNFLASNLQIGGDKVVEFSETENGIIKVDLKGIFPRNNH